MPTKQNDPRTAYVTRENVMKLLSNEEVADVASTESDIRLADGDEYLDLEQLDQGVQRSPGANTPMGRVLPKKAVRDTTWVKILQVLAKPTAVAAHHGA
jgi:hypothetical protein